MEEKLAARLNLTEREKLWIGPAIEAFSKKTGTPIKRLVSQILKYDDVRDDFRELFKIMMKKIAQRN